MTSGTLGRAILLPVCVLLTCGPATASDGAVGVPTLQGSVGAQIFGPRRMAATSSGQFVVIDAKGQLNLLTKRGDFVATLLNGVRAVTAGGGKIYAVNDRVEFVVLDERNGKVLGGKVHLGLGVSPTGMSWDAARGVVWSVFSSGVVQSRAVDGSLVSEFRPSGTGGLFRLVDVAVDASSGVIWVAQDHESPGGMIFGLDPVSGARLKVIGASGVGPAKLTGALLVGSGGQLFVADLNLNKVEVVAPDDTRVQTIGLSQTGVGTLEQPAGMAVMENGDLLVANLLASRIDRFGDGRPLPECVGDGDCDGMNDAWEGQVGLDSTSAQDALKDLDGDGLVNLEEYALGTAPGNVDTDGDGESDAVEVANGTDPLRPPNVRPVLVASGATEFVPGLVRLSATVTEIPDPSKCTAQWTQAPEDERTVALRKAEGFAPTFPARKGAYHFTVVATCGGVKSDPIEVTANVVNVSPMAVATRVQVVEGGAAVTLDAGRSDDANGDPLAHAWEQLTGPVVTGGETTSALTATFSAPGTHDFRATVTDPSKLGDAVESSVVVVGKQKVPVAVVATPVVGKVGGRIALDATASIVAGAAGYSWRQVAGPQVPVVGDGLAAASFEASEAGRYTFEVTVTKAGIQSPPGRVEVYVAAADGALPVAVAKAPAVAAVGTEATLDGAGSTSSSGSAEYAWRQVSGPATGVGSADRAMATAYLFEPGSYEFELTVKDGAGVGAPMRVRVEARKDGKPIPFAKVSGPATVVTGARVSLDARGSTGAKGYRWAQVGGPWTVIEGTSVATFRPKSAGTYEFELEVDDGLVRSAPARVSVAVVGDEAEE